MGNQGCKENCQQFLKSQQSRKEQRKQQRQTDEFINSDKNKIRHRQTYGLQSKHISNFTATTSAHPTHQLKKASHPFGVQDKEYSNQSINKGKGQRPGEDNQDMEIKKTTHPFGKLLQSHPKCKSEVQNFLKNSKKYDFMYKQSQIFPEIEAVEKKI